MKEDNICQLGDHDTPLCEQQYMHGSCYISLFKFKSFDQLNTPQTASNFRHLLSCGTIVKKQRYFISLWLSKTVDLVSIEAMHTDTC